MASTSNRALLANYLLGQQSSAMGKNYISNPSAFMNTVGTSVSGSATIARNTTSPLTAISDFSISLPNNATDYVAFSTDTFDSSMSGKNCELRLDYTASSIGSNVVVQIVQGSNIVASSSALSTASTARTVSVNAPCGDLSSATTIRVANSTGNSGTSALKVANVTYGLATNLSQVSQAQLYGSIRWAPTAGCEWTTGDTNNTLTDFLADTDCPAPTVTGAAKAPATKVPRIEFDQLPPGQYYVVATGHFGIATASVNATGTFELFDGISNSGTTFIRAWSSLSAATSSQSVVGLFQRTTAASNVSIRLRAKTDTNNNDPYIINSSVDLAGEYRIDVYRFPSTSELAYRPDQVGWRVDARIGGAVVSNASGELTNASLALASASDSLPVGIACNSTNPSVVGATTCASGTEAIGVTFVVPTAGVVEACWGANWYNSSGTGSAVSFQLVETSNSGNTAIQTPSAFSYQGLGTATQTEFNVYNTGNCAQFNFTSAGQKTLKLFGTSTSGALLIDGGTAADSNRKFFVTIKPITQSIPAPLLVGSVTSSSTGLERVERAYVADGSTCPATICTITSQSNWLNSVIKNSTGNYTLNITSGVFSGIPSCVIQHSQNETSIEPGASATQLNFTTKNASGTVTDASRVMILCQGPR